MNQMSNLLHGIRIKTKRDLRLFFWCLSDKDLNLLIAKQSKIKGGFDSNLFFGSNIGLASDAINQAVRLIKEDKSKYCLSFNFFRMLTLPDREFSWLKKSPEAGYYAWFYIRTRFHDQYSNFSTDFHVIRKITSGKYPSGHDFLYNKLQLIQYPADNKERIQSIIDFFDRVPVDLQKKFHLMQMIRQEWDRIYPFITRFPLTPTDKKKCEWAWDYIRKDRSNMYTRQRREVDNKQSEVINKPSEFHEDIFSVLRPSDSYEKYLAAKFYCISLFPGDELLIKRFKKAWELSSYRKSKRENKVSGVKEPKMEDSYSEVTALPESEVAKSEKDINREKARKIIEEMGRKHQKKDDDSEC